MSGSAIARAFGGAVLCATLSGSVGAAADADASPAARSVPCATLSGFVGAAAAVDADASPAARSSSIQALLAEDRWPEALQRAEALQREFPDDPAVQALRGECLLRAGRPAEAWEILEPLSHGPAPGPRGLVALARLHAARGRHLSAFDLAQRAVALAPADRFVLRAAAEHAPTRAVAIERLERYLELSAGDDAERVQSARSTLAIWRELGERSIWVAGERPRRLEIPLKLVWTEQGQRLGYVVEARIAGRKRPLRLLLDTGSTGFFLVDRVLPERGFEELGREVAYGGGGDGRHDVRRGLLDQIEIGGLSFSRAMVTTTRHEFDPVGRFHGLIGLFPFDGYRLTLDLERRRLLLEPPVDEPAEGEPYWMFSGQMLVQAAVEQGPAGLFLLDTGATSSVLSQRLAADLEPARRIGEAAVRGFGGRVRLADQLAGVRLRFLELAPVDEPIHALDLSLVSRLGGVELAGYLGLDLLHGSVLVFDTQARTLRAYRNSAPGP